MSTWKPIIYGLLGYGAPEPRGLAGIDAGLRERDDDPKELELAEAHRRVEHEKKQAVQTEMLE